MARIIVNANSSGGGKGRVQLPGTNTYVDAPIYVGTADPAGSGAVEPYAWIDADALTGGTGGGGGTGASTAAGITDSTTVGRSVLTAADATAARSAIGAGTSNLTLGSTASTAKAGNYVPAWSEITSKPTTFAPAAHNHATADVTGLDAALNARMVVVAFGTTAGTSRPANVPNGGVYWVGTGTTVPSNALPADLVFLP